ncbi:PREDICTED: LOW QUALITY PROTEIN: acid-sensing ion channel 4-like, partial [Tauraco erythrolophus]|uniref:LOW QUALITY PROTEIN: acid-sensing ion channel 4-like n=1 Tax=Tauraco erythrolophus TaxID=121530 RepID=UPI000523B034
PGSGRNFPFPNGGRRKACVCSSPLLSLPSPVTGAAQEVVCHIRLWEGAEQKPPGKETSGTACTSLAGGATLPAAMPLPLACCQDGEALAAAQDSSAAQLTLLATGTTDRLHHLLSHPVHTRARLAWAPQLRFPAVTLCNSNRARFLRLTKPDLYSVGQWLGLAQENRSLVPEMLAVLGEDRRAWLTRLANYSRFLPPRRSERTMQSFFHRLGHQIEDMLVECRFQGEHCGPQHFAPCYTFNGDRRNPRVTRQGGMGNGLEIMLDIQQEEYLPIWRETSNESICSPNVYIECADHTLDAAVEDSQERCSCPTPCNLTRYGKEISMVRIPNKGSARYLARKYNKNETYIRENFLVLDIFFEALNYEAIEQKKAYDLAGLLGDIGGQMGLFIGASILTILEILDYVYEVIRDRVSRVLRRSKPPLKKPSGSIATLGLEELKDQYPCREGLPGGLQGQDLGTVHPCPK